MTLTVRARSADDTGAYTRFLDAQAHAMLYYTARYARFLTTLLGCHDCSVLVWDGDAVVGVLPLMRAEGSLGFVYNSLPYYGSHGGPLANTPQARAALLDYFAAVAAAPDTAVAMMVQNPFDTDAIALDIPECTPLSDARISQMTPLAGAGELLSLLDSSARRNIRKAAKNGITVAVENDRFDFLQTTHIDTMQAMGGAAKTPAFFEAVQQVLTADVDYTLHVARHDGEAVAALLTLYAHGVAEYFTPVTTTGARALEPMAAILEEAMTQAAHRGCTWWNWGGTWDTQDGVYRFKKKWGAQDRRYAYHIHMRNRDVLGQTPQELLRDYPGFYVVPFDQLEGTP